MKKKYLIWGIVLSLGLLQLPVSHGEAAGQDALGEPVEMQSSIQSDAPQIQIDSGMIRGSRESNGVMAFKGIPYAASTAGQNRFQGPQPVKSWSGVRDCTHFGPITVQPEAHVMGPWTDEYVDLGLNLANGRMSEDCLNLNVWSDAQAGVDQPVIVYIHGGANVSGSSENDIYTGKNIAAKGVVYVSINYRVGIFGFLAYKDSTGEEVTGNFALQDQIAALKWVQRNIRAFGGNPDNVTIMGQSAGAINVQNLISSQAAAGLFKKAIALSFNSITTEYPSITTLEEAERKASQALKGKTLAELRQMPPEEIMALGYNPSAAVRGTATGTIPLKEAFATDSWNKVDMIWGGVAGDPYIFDSMIPLGDVFSPLNFLTAEEYANKVQHRFGKNALKVMKLYSGKENALETAQKLNQDGLIATYAYAGHLKEKADPAYSTYIYYYDHVVPDNAERQQKYGAFHTGDVSYWLDYYSSMAKRPWTETDYKLGGQMSSYIINFVKTGTPNGTDMQGIPLPLWPKVKRDASIGYLHIGDSIAYKEMTEDKAHLWRKMWR